MVLRSGDLFFGVSGVSHTHINTCQNNPELDISQFAAPAATHLQAPSRKKTSSIAGCIYNLAIPNVDLQTEKGSVGKTASQNRLKFQTELKEVKGGVSDQQTLCRHF